MASQEAPVAVPGRMVAAWIKAVVRIEGCGLSPETQSLTIDWILW